MNWFKRRDPSKRRKKFWRYVAGIFVLLLVADVALTRYWQHISLGRDTTRITAPINSVGFPNYLQALNDLSSEGVTNDNNAAPLLMEVLGTDVIVSDEATRPRWREIALPRIGLTSAAMPALLRTFDQWTDRNGPTTSPATAETHPADELHEMLKSPWKSAAHPRWTAWLEEQQSAIDKAHAALERPRLFIPYIAIDGERVMMMHVVQTGPLRNLGAVLVADAMRRLGDGDFPGFKRNITDALRLSGVVGRRPTLLESVLAIGIQSTTVVAVQRAAASPQGLSPAQAAEMLKVIDALSPLPGLAQAIDHTERWFALDTVCAAAKYGWTDLRGSSSRSSDGWIIQHFAPIHYDLMLREANGCYDRLVSAFALPTYRQRQAELKAVQADVTRRTTESAGARIMHPSLALSNLLLSILMPPMDRAAQLEEEGRMDVQLARLALALRMYRGAHGQFPEALDTLAPDLFHEIPQDTFIDLPLHYRRQDGGYLLYSVGRDLKDDGGLERDHGSASFDIVVKAAQ